MDGSNQVVYRRVEAEPMGGARPAFPAGAELRMVPISALVIDDRYQRPLGPSNWKAIDRIAKDFAWARFSPLLLAPVDAGRFAIIDGQHRAHAAARRGYTEVPAMIMPMGLSEQAAAFSWVNGNVTAVTLFHVYKAALASGETWAVAARSAVEAAGCTLMTSNRSTAQKQAGEVYAISLVRKYVQEGRSDVVRTALGAIRTADADGDPFLYSAACLDPWFSVVDEPEFAGWPLSAFLRSGRLARILDEVDLARRDDRNRGVPRKKLARDMIRRELRQWREAQ